jgi:hypothetical protein
MIIFIVLTEWQPVAVRRSGRPSLRWEGDVRVDLGEMNIQNWCKVAMDREAWNRTV